MKPIRANFYAFALNEFRFKKVSFTTHRTQTEAERSAYEQSGQSARSKRRDWIGAESAHDDLYPQVVAGLEGFEVFAKESNYRIDWDERMLYYVEPRMEHDMKTKTIADYLPDPKAAPTDPILLIQAKVPRKLGLEVRKILRKKGIDWKSFVTAALNEYRETELKKVKP